jgi:hypothetical protein
MEVCCIHNSRSSSAAKHAQQQQQQHKAAACLHHRRSPSAHAHFQDANLMPGTPNGSRSRHLDAASGLYPSLSSTEVPGACCFCPNCCSNSYVTPEQSAANAALTDAGLGLESVAVQRLTVRVLGQKSRFGANGRQLPGCYRIELSSDSSLFFLFVGTITEAGFLEIKVRRTASDTVLCVVVGGGSDGLTALLCMCECCQQSAPAASGWMQQA